MEIDFNQKLKNLDGSVIKETDKKDSADVTLKLVCIVALTAIIRGEQVDGTEKYKRWKLTGKIDKGGKIKLTTDEISYIKELIGKVHGVVITGQSYDMLEKENKKGD